MAIYTENVFFYFVKTFNAFATHEKKEVYLQIP